MVGLLGWTMRVSLSGELKHKKVNKMKNKTAQDVVLKVKLTAYTGWSSVMTLEATVAVDGEELKSQDPIWEDCIEQMTEELQDRVVGVDASAEAVESFTNGALLIGGFLDSYAEHYSHGSAEVISACELADELAGSLINDLVAAGWRVEVEGRKLKSVADFELIGKDDED